MLSKILLIWLESKYVGVDSNNTKIEIYND